MKTNSVNNNYIQLNKAKIKNSNSYSNKLNKNLDNNISYSQSDEEDNYNNKLNSQSKTAKKIYVNQFSSNSPTPISNSKKINSFYNNFNGKIFGNYPTFEEKNKFSLSQKKIFVKNKFSSSINPINLNDKFGNHITQININHYII